MGRQIIFHMFPDDCQAFLAFVQERDSVILTPFTGDSAQVDGLDRMDCFGKWLCLWNQRLLASLARERVREASPTHRVDDSLPVLELSFSKLVKWSGYPAATQGRLYAFGYHLHPELRTWYEALARWIRKRYVRNPLSWMGGYVGPEAYAWHVAGGLLLPTCSPPVNPEWVERILAQHART
jgi:hypothetical protein